MSITRYSALSVSRTGSDPGLSIVGGAAALTDENDLSSYLDWNFNASTGGSPTFRVEFGKIRGLTENSRLILHIVGTAVRKQRAPGELTTSFARLVPIWLEDSTGGWGHQLGASGGFPSMTGLRPGSVVESIQPLLPYATNSGFDFSADLAIQSNQLSFGLSGGYHSFRLYGIYLTVQEGFTVGEPLVRAPYVAFGMYNGGFVVLDSDGQPLLANGNQMSAGQASFAAWVDGSVAMPYSILKTPFAVLQPRGAEIYTMADISRSQLAADYINNGSAAGGDDLSLIPMSSSATIMVTWVKDPYDTPTPVFWEFSRDGTLLNEWLPKFPAHTATGYPEDNFFPQTGDRFGDMFIFNGGSSGTTSGRFDFTYGSGVYGGDVMAMNLTTGEVRVLIPDADIGQYAGAAPGPPSYGEPFLGALCVDPIDGDIYLYLADQGYDDSRNDAQIWISRWGQDGTFKGKVGFNDDHVGAPWEWDAFVYHGPGGIRCCDDGRLIFFYAGTGPWLEGFGQDEYDGLLQLDKRVVPTDGSIVYVTPTPFWRSLDGTLEGLGGDVTKMMGFTRDITGSLQGTSIEFIKPIDSP